MTALTSANTRAERKVARRRLLYTRRINAATTDRDRINALVGWWMAEWHRLDPARRVAEFDRLHRICEDLTTRSAATDGDDGSDLPLASAARNRDSSPCLLTRAREDTPLRSTRTVTRRPVPGGVS